MKLKNKLSGCIGIILILATQIVQAQDTTYTVKPDVAEKSGGFFSIFEEPEGLTPSPKKAIIYSLICPGAGQIYNKKQWYIRAPVAAGVVGGGIYFYFSNRTNYIFYRDVLRNKALGISTNFDNVPDSSIRTVRDDYRKRMERALFLTIFAHLLNGIEAFSTAHLIHFDIDEDLSFELQPVMENNYGMQSLGIGISIPIN